MQKSFRHHNHSVSLWTDRYGQIQISVDGVKSFGASGSSLVDWQLAEQRARQIVDAMETSV